MDTCGSQQADIFRGLAERQPDPGNTSSDQRQCPESFRGLVGNPPDPGIFRGPATDPGKIFQGLVQVSENFRRLAGANSILPGQSVCAKTFRDSM
jgi:hypothetical protein